MTRTIAGRLALLLFRHAASERYPTRTVEHLLAWMLLVWSLAVAVPGRMLVGPQYEYLVTLAPEALWGWVGVTFGVLRLSTGESVVLDRGVLLGRAPAVPTDGVDLPHVVRVSGPDNDVSRNHAEIVLEGWHVSVRDLGSTNGTTVVALIQGSTAMSAILNSCPAK